MCSMQEIPGSNPGIFDFIFLSIFAQNSYCGKSPDNVFWTSYDLNYWPQWSKIDCKKFYVKWPSSPCEWLYRLQLLCLNSFGIRQEIQFHVCPRKDRPNAKQKLNFVLKTIIHTLLYCGNNRRDSCCLSLFFVYLTNTKFLLHVYVPSEKLKTQIIQFKINSRILSK